MSRLWILELPEVALISSQLGCFRSWSRVKECACDRSMCTTTVLALLQDFKICSDMQDHGHLIVETLRCRFCSHSGVVASAFARRQMHFIMCVISAESRLFVAPCICHGFYARSSWDKALSTIHSMYIWLFAHFAPLQQQSLWVDQLSVSARELPGVAEGAHRTNGATALQQSQFLNS